MKKIRRSQLVNPFGPGSICDILGESFVVCDTSRWGNSGKRLRSRRLEEHLRTKTIREAPKGPDEYSRDKSHREKGVELQRFPRWLFCPKCRRLQFWNFENETGKDPKCHFCNDAVLVPMRFIMVCKNGHLSDVPWSFFLHSGTTNCSSKNLEFHSLKGKGGGLDSLIVKCRDCETQKSLGNLTQKNFMKRIGARCSGKQPWQSPGNAEDCDETPQVVQRGASNVYFPRVYSALDLPPDSFYNRDKEKENRIINTDTFKTLLSFDDDANQNIIDKLVSAIANDHGVDVEFVRELMREQREEGGEEGPVEDIEDAEWEAFRKEYGHFHEKDTFITEHVEFLSSAQENSRIYTLLDSYIDKVVIARKLREVRVLRGYHRYSPEGETISPTFDRLTPYLPGIEVFGEGIFISFDEKRISEWEKKSSVFKRAEELQNRKEVSVFNSWLPTVTPRFVLLHTLAHLLIRQMAFESGYSSASLRERIYSKKDPTKPQAGILIYTAAGDSEGTLGGLARKGEPPRLAKIFISAFRSAVWCSNDPICIEMKGQGLDDLNKAACHACALVSETSCVYNNALLDRGMLFGDDTRNFGFFNEITDELFESV